MREPERNRARRGSKHSAGLLFGGPPVVGMMSAAVNHHVVDQGGTLSRIDRGTDAKVDRARTRASSGTSSRTRFISRQLVGKPRRNIVFLALLFALGACAVAIAKPGGAVTGDTPAAPGNPGLAQRGAVAKNGFPSWYKDKNGVRLEPCLDASDPLCIMGALPDPNAPVTQDDVTGNFPDEFFYQAGDAGIDNVGATDAPGQVRQGQPRRLARGRVLQRAARGQPADGLRPPAPQGDLRPAAGHRVHVRAPVRRAEDQDRPGRGQPLRHRGHRRLRRHLRRRAQGPHRAVPQVGPRRSPRRRRTATSATRTSTTRSRAASTTTSRSSARASARTS